MKRRGGGDVPPFAVAFFAAEMIRKKRSRSDEIFRGLLCSRQRAGFRRMRRARVMFVQIDRQLLAQAFIRSDRMLEKFFLNAAREARPKVEGSVSDDGLKS